MQPFMIGMIGSVYSAAQIFGGLGMVLCRAPALLPSAPSACLFLRTAHNFRPAELPSCSQRSNDQGIRGL